MNVNHYLIRVQFSSARLLAAIFVLVLCTVSIPAFAVPPSLEDQNGKVGGMDDFSGKPVVVFVTSLTQLANLGKWEEAIRPDVPNINSMDIGDIKKAPGFIRKEVIKELKKHVPEGVSVYIDDNNLWEQEYKLDLGEPCVLLFDANHELTNQFRGKPGGQLLDEVVAATKKLFPAPAASDAGS